jgi:hypothetical protein
MSKQTKVWLDHYQVPIERLTASKLVQWVTSLLIITDYPSATAQLKNAAIRELLAEVKGRVNS